MKRFDVFAFPSSVTSVSFLLDNVFSPLSLANFRHIKHLHMPEPGKGCKIAYKLSDKCLDPIMFECPTVQLADAIFHESTIDDLLFSGQQYPDFVQTAEFLKHVRPWFNILKVRNCSLGRHKSRSEARRILGSPCTLPSGWTSGRHQVVRDAVTRLSLQPYKHHRVRLSWPSTVSFGCETIEVPYVLAGQIQSDAIGCHFGQYRQAGNWRKLICFSATVTWS